MIYSYHEPERRDTVFKNKNGELRSGWKIAGMLGTVFGVLFLLMCVYHDHNRESGSDDCGRDAAGFSDSSDHQQFHDVLTDDRYDHDSDSVMDEGAEKG